MTSRWNLSRWKICFLVAVCGAIVVLLLILAHYVETYRSESSKPGSWQKPSPTILHSWTPTTESMRQSSTPGLVEVLVESERVQPFETPPPWFSRPLGKEERESTLRPPVVNDGSGSSKIVSSVSDGHINTNSIISNNIDNDDMTQAYKLQNGTIEYAYITKLARPLHQDDLLYDSKTDVSDGRRGSQIHATGAFRSRSSKVWDPHPEYELNVFGIKIHLKLSHDEEFIQKDMKVTHFWPNETLRKSEDHEESRWLQGCYYKGIVVGDAYSNVRVNLCEGMHGHIKTSNASFLIQPAENASGSDANILHRIQRLKADKTNSGIGGRILVDGSSIPAQDCAVQTDHEAADRLSSHQTDNDYLSPHSRTRRSLDHFISNDYTVEVLVVVDNTMLRYHKQNLNSYVLTLMSIVSSVYADASIGTSMKIAVTHISYIHHDLNAQTEAAMKGLEGVSASDMLQDFCKFKQTTNFHHDVALLLTREQICRNPAENNCDTLGLAELGTICRDTSCAIVQDNGLSASFTIAHEIGHVLGMPHDDDQRCKEHLNDTLGNNRIMARTIDQNTHPWQWSKCSEKILREFLEKNPDNCMLNHPSTDLMSRKDLEQLAGEKFTNDKQCELVYGNGSKICSYMPVCQPLWCSLENEMAGCKTQHMPWADGTECSDGHWCQKGKCVPIDRTTLKPQNGGWGAWKSFSKCSQTCGGGIQHRTRDCDSPQPKNGGKFCSGLRIEYRPCNTQPCPNWRYNFRDEQCHELNGQNFDVPSLERNVRWIPKYGTPVADQCKLLCRVQDKSLYFTLKEKVIDGTPCTFPEDSFDMCINGQCRKAGCDYVLNSDAKLDRCGVCKGDNSTCQPVTGSLRLDSLDDNVFHIQEGATNIEVVHSGYMRDISFLSVISGNEIIFNDPKHPTLHNSKHRIYAGVRLEYTISGSVERITSSFGRPLREKLTVRRIKKHNNDKNDYVTFSFLVPIHPLDNTLSNAIYPKHELEPYHHNQHLHRPHYSGNSVHRLQHTVSTPESLYRWEMSQWTECDQQCSGKKRRMAICFNTDTQQEVSPDNCNQSVKPQDLYESCNTECKYYWEPGRTECSSTCGNGTIKVDYKCVRSYSKTQRQEHVDNGLCYGLTKPTIDRAPCQGPCKNAIWRYSQWNKCSCSDGTQNRTADCLSEPNGFVIADSYCENKLHKEISRTCDADEQDCARWVTGEPTPCSVTCGEGQRTYALQCMLKNVSVNAALCGARPEPVVMNCTMPSCDQKPLPNTQYSSFRNDVQPNHSMKNGNYHSTAEHSPVPSGKWRTYSFSNCSAECDGGFKKRLVRCLGESGQVLEDRYCPHPKPHTQINCANVRCPTWTFGQWSKCNDECIRSRQVLCQDHRGKDSNQCSTELKPPAVESCCSFKWRITCAGPCGAEGRRLPKVICKRLFPKSIDNPHPFRTGRKVDSKYCTNIKMPTPMKLKKKCNKPCPFRWVPGSWSECSVGCGSGRTVRNVTCTDGRTISPKACNATLKPPNTKVCEALTHCRWRISKPSKCNCKGRQNRTVKCYDEKLKAESNRCSESTRPSKTTTCQKPPGCRTALRNRHHEPVYRNCKDAQRKHRTDGEYTMLVNGTRTKIYCHGMATGSPSEYLSLPAGPTENYAIYINRRAADANKCEHSRRDWADESISYGATHYRKIRINVSTLQVYTNDFRFTNSSGKKQPFGSAGDCYSNTGHCPQGDFAINLNGTPFRIRPHTSWEKSGVNSVIKFLVPLQSPYQKVRALCGGYCGSCSVSRSTNLYLELV